MMAKPSVQDDLDLARVWNLEAIHRLAIDEMIHPGQKLPCGDALDFVAEIPGAGIGQQPEFWSAQQPAQLGKHGAPNRLSRYRLNQSPKRRPSAAKNCHNSCLV